MAEAKSLQASLVVRSEKKVAVQSSLIKMCAKMCENKMPGEKDAQETVKLWMNTTAKDYHRQLESIWGIGRKVARLAKISKEDFVLDVGCGTGRCTIPVKFEIGAEIIGVDMSIQRLKTLRSLSKAKIPVVLADATALPFRNKVFNKIISNEVWIHIPHQNGRKEYISEMARVIKMNGHVFISGIYRSIFLPKDTWKRKSKGWWYAHTFSIAEIIASFTRAELRNLKVHPSLLLTSRSDISRASTYAYALYKVVPNIFKLVVAWFCFSLIDIEAYANMTETLLNA